jgi:prepilin-type N-terminal cleavage/methylation domain-containing protein
MIYLIKNNMERLSQSMDRKNKKSGLSLTEVLTSIVIIAILAAISLPAVKAVFHSFSSTGSAEAMVNAALSNARAMAMREQRYVGVRFQKAYNSSNQNPLDAAQYMIFIINDTDATGLAYGFRAVEGIEPIKMPDNTGVADLQIILDHNPTKDPLFVTENQILTDNQINSTPQMLDTSTFSIVFSPQGNLVIHGVRVRNINGRTDDSSRDDVFNTNINVDKGIGKFYQDDYFETSLPDFGLGPEPSRRSFVIYEQDKFRKAFLAGTAFTSYLKPLLDTAGPIYINSYNGSIMSTGTGQ